MNQPATSAAMTPRRILWPATPIHAPKPSTMIEESLPFTVRLVRDEEDLNKAVQIRHSAYARHMPTIAESLRFPEKADTEDGVVVLLAESKLDGTPLGTARIQTNQFRALALEESVEFPDWLRGRTLAHISRLGIVQGNGGRLVKFMLFKGLFKYWEQNDIEWAVVAARVPLDRMYEQLLFQDVFPGRGFIPLPHMNHVPHRVMAFEVATAFERWTQAKHPLTNFICHTDHPDLDISCIDRDAYSPAYTKAPTMGLHIPT